jgi:5-carboxymethyl-2-hydroxymuconate isomerase
MAQTDTAQLSRPGESLDVSKIMSGMPQITVEYSAALTDAFDRHGFALALHPAAAELIGSALPDFKTRFRPITEAVIGTGELTEAMVHVDLAILPGRDMELKTRLGDLTLAMLCDHIKPGTGLNTQVTVEVRDMASYHKRVLGL